MPFFRSVSEEGYREKTTTEEKLQEDAGSRKEVLTYSRRKSTGDGSRSTESTPQSSDGISGVVGEEKQGHHNKELTKDGCYGASNHCSTTDTAVEGNHQSSETYGGCEGTKKNAPRREDRIKEDEKVVQHLTETILPMCARELKESDVIHRIQEQEKEQEKQILIDINNLDSGNEGLSSRPESEKNHKKEPESSDGQNSLQIPERVWFKINNIQVCMPPLKREGGNAPDIAVGEKTHQAKSGGNDSSGPPTNIDIDLNTEYDLDDQVQLAALKDSEVAPGGASSSGIRKCSGYMIAKGDTDMKKQYDPMMILNGRKRSIELREGTRKKSKLRLFGIDIPCDQEQHDVGETENNYAACDVASGSHRMQKPVDDVSEEQIRPTAKGCGCHGGGGDQSSVKQPIARIRLFGFDL